MRCSQPDCPGNIADGYCDYCGMPAGSAPSAPAQTTAASPARTTSGSPGVRPSRPAFLQGGIPRPSVGSANQGPRPQQRPRPPSGPPASTSGPNTSGARANPTGARPNPDPPGRVGGPCRRQGCSGTIVDGYCNYCGTPVGASGVSETLLGTTLSATVSAADLGTVLIGSALAGTDSDLEPKRSGSTRAHTRIGAGITNVPPAPALDPEASLLDNPLVPEARRFCFDCGAQVGRGTDGSPGPVTGTCPKCGLEFDFRPSIKAGTLVAHQYEVSGAIAYGGMGWIYLARDRNVSDRWVVLKGLINRSDADATKAAKSEQEFLAKVEHPLIVEIYNFVEHEGERYIVMEYVPGRSITDLMKQRRDANDGVIDPLPVEWALAYVIEILPAFTYLHDRGLLYCDFKPDNLMQVGDSLKLIDLGAVRRIDDNESAIFGTVGYQAPEVAELGTSVTSDLYTIGRSLVVMSADFKGFQTEYVDSLPPVSKIPVFNKHDSFYRLIQRTCARNPKDRFQNAEDLRQQALGVMREVVGRKSKGVATAAAVSTLFSAPTAVENVENWQQLPQLLPDQADPMTTWLRSLTMDNPARRREALAQAPERTPAVILAEIELAMATGDARAASARISELLRLDPWDWRAVWMQGMLAVQEESWHAAQAPFNTVFSQVPGEVAAKFALAVACEYGERPLLAEELYAICASTDANYVTPSAFGMARLRMARDDRPQAIAALSLVPATSRGYGEARRLHAQLTLRTGGTLPELASSYESLINAGLHPRTSAKMEIDLLTEAIQMVKKTPRSSKYTFAGQPATERNLRQLLESAYQTAARWATDEERRQQLLTEADSQRGWSIW